MEETIHGTTMPVLELSLQPRRVRRVRGRRVQLDVRRGPDADQHRRRHGRQGDHGRRQARRLGRQLHDDHVHRARRLRLDRLRLEGARSHPPHRRGAGQRVHGAPARLHGGHAGDRAVDGIPAVVPRRHLRRRGLHPPEDRRSGPRLHRSLGRGDRLRPPAGPDDAGAPGPRRSLPGVGDVLGAEGARSWPTATWAPTATTSRC